MDKEYAIKLIKEENTMTLIESLLSQGDNELVLILLQECWGYTDDEVIDYINNEWEY